MEDLSEEAIKKNCPHCNISSQAFEFILENTKNFYIICDANPLVEGHILIIPKKHLTCVGAYTNELLQEFLELNKKVSKFILDNYNSIASFEHGIFGQTVFHSHIHYLPFSGEISNICKESSITKVNGLRDLKVLLDKDGGYLFFSIGNKLFSVNKKEAKPRYFRDKFAKALGRRERGNWKKIRANMQLLIECQKDCVNTQKKWQKYYS